MNKPFAEACERNREPILSVLKPLLADCRAVLEIGSGTGQHAVYFAKNMPHLCWQTSDRPEYLPGIRQWLDEAALVNTPAPLSLDVSQTCWPVSECDAVFSANTVHIMAWEEVKAFVQGAGRVLSRDGLFILYGPFNYGNRYTSDSNRQFDAWLKARDPESGIRNFEDLHDLAGRAGMEFIEDREIPANNRILCWKMTRDSSLTPPRDASPHPPTGCR